MRELLVLARSANPGAVRVLDAGGGTGNAAMMMLEMGLEPVVVDVSPEMLAHWQRKAAARGFDAPVVASDIAGYLEAEESEWDLITFSSVLHHLENPAEVLGSAARRLAPGGVLITIFDPIQAGRLGALLRRADWITNAAIRDRESLRAAAAARREVREAGSAGGPHVGQIAERHARDGLPDSELVGTLRAQGLAILRHDRLYDARYRLIRAVYGAVRRPSTFSIVAQRPDR